jgi:predicted solute-binding protein
MLHGPQKDQVDLSFAIPSICARELETDKIQVGLVPVAEAVRQNLEIVPGVAITCHGAVRSILLFSRVPWTKVRTLAADLSSRTSVQLARVILRENYGVEPEVIQQPPVLTDMLEAHDAALIIGDPALHIDPHAEPYDWLDLGSEWLRLTGLPMVFAAWAGKRGIDVDAIQAITMGSYEYGKARIDEIVEREYHARGIARDLATRYLTQHIRYELGKEEQKGLKTFVELARLVPAPAGVHSR